MPSDKHNPQTPPKKRLTREPLTLDTWIKQTNFPECGALCTFSGIVRNHHEGQSVLKLQYSAYESMAEREMDKLIEETRHKWRECHIEACHRLGELVVGDVAVIIAVWAPHRREAFAACEALINAIKVRVPVWKKEFYADHSSEWVICEHKAQEEICSHPSH